MKSMSQIHFLRQKGQALVMQKDLKKALLFYRAAIQLLEPLRTENNTPENDIEDLERRCVLTLAECYLRTGQLQHAVVLCSQLIHSNETHFSPLSNMSESPSPSLGLAYLRRALALRDLGEIHCARSDVAKAACLLPSSHRKCQELRQELRLNVDVDDLTKTEAATPVTQATQREIEVGIVGESKEQTTVNLDVDTDTETALDRDRDGQEQEVCVQSRIFTVVEDCRKKALALHGGKGLALSDRRIQQLIAAATPISPMSPVSSPLSHSLSPSHFSSSSSSAVSSSPLSSMLSSPLASMALKSLLGGGSGGKIDMLSLLKRVMDPDTAVLLSDMVTALTRAGKLFLLVYRTVCEESLELLTIFVNNMLEVFFLF